MSLGLGIFLSALLISIVYLFQKFPNSKRWKQLKKALFLVTIILPLIASLSWYCYNLYADYRDKNPQQVTEYWGVKLGEGLENVRFMKGIPNEEFEFYISSLGNFDIGKADIANNEGHSYTVPLVSLSNALHSKKYKISAPSLMKTKSKETFEAWEYDEGYYDKTKYFVRFTEKNTVGAISCSGDSTYSCPKIASVGINTTWEEVIKIFGSPPYGYIDFNDGKRVVCYPQYNLCFTLEKSKLQFITIKYWKAKDYYYWGKAVVDIINNNKDKYTYAIKAFNQAIKLDQEYAKAYIEKGWTLYKIKEYEAAINSYNYATNLGYKSADLYNQRGLALEHSNRTQEAMKSFDEAIKFDPLYTSAYVNKARLLSNEREYEKAIITLDKAIELGRKDSWGLSLSLEYKGDYLSKLNKYEEAIKVYNESITAESIQFNNSHTYHKRGIALHALGRHKEAIESIKKAIDIDPTDKKFKETLQNLYPKK